MQGFDGRGRTLIYTLTDRTLFPNLRSIVVAGHSAGAQFVQRYAGAGRGEEHALVPIRYVAANPSSYMYLNALRLPDGHTCSDEGVCDAGFARRPASAACPTFNDFKYGMEKTTGCVGKALEKDIRRQYVARWTKAAKQWCRGKAGASGGRFSGATCARCSRRSMGLRWRRDARTRLVVCSNRRLGGRRCFLEERRYSGADPKGVIEDRWLVQTNSGSTSEHARRRGEADRAAMCATTKPAFDPLNANVVVQLAGAVWTLPAKRSASIPSMPSSRRKKYSAACTGFEKAARPRNFGRKIFPSL